MLVIHSDVFGQDNNGSYEYLSFKDFMSTKVANDSSFVEQIYTNVKYPNSAKVNEIEGRVEVLIFNHVNQNIEIILLNQPIAFYGIKSQLEMSFRNVKIDLSAPFITRFYIYFNLEKKKFPKNYSFYKYGIYNENSFDIVGYNVPNVIFH